jgi:hypothetical protein
MSGSYIADVRVMSALPSKAVIGDWHVRLRANSRHCVRDWRMFDHPIDLRSLKQERLIKSVRPAGPHNPRCLFRQCGQITEVQKAHIRLRRFEVKLDFFRYRDELFPERRGKSPLVEISKPKGDCRSDQGHDHARPGKPIRACLSGHIKGKCSEQPSSRYQETKSNNSAIEPRVKQFNASFTCGHFWLGGVQGPAPQVWLYRCPNTVA